MHRFPETTFTYGNFERDEEGCLSEPVYQPEEESGPIMSLADCYLNLGEVNPDQPERSGAGEGEFQDAVSSAVALRGDAILLAPKLNGVGDHRDKIGISPAHEAEEVGNQLLLIARGPGARLFAAVGADRN